MTTWILTPKNADPITKLANPVIGWQLTAASALDVLEGIDTVALDGWVGNLSDPNQTVSPPLYTLVLMKSGAPTVTVNDTDWFTLDGAGNVSAIPAATVTTDYTVAAQT